MEKILKVGKANNMSELIYKKVNEVFRNIDGHYYKCVEGIGCRNCAFRGTGSCGQYVCAEATRPDRVPVKFVAVSDEPIEPKKEKEMEKDTATEEPSRHIELGVVKVEGDNVTFKIIEQTHRCGDFSQQSGHQYFKASNGTELASRAFPEWKGNYPLSCRGCACGEDDKELTCTAAEFALISEAVTEYNNTDGKGYEKPWPQNGDGYFYIASRGRIEYTEFTDEPFDTDCKAYGNFFRTEEEAMSAAEKVKALFKELAGRAK